MSTVCDDAMDVLERRLNTIERKVYGQEESRKGPTSRSGAVASASSVTTTTPCVTKLTEMAKECGNALESRERIAPLLRKLNDLETYLDPSLGCEFSGLSSECKADLVLANESRLRNTNALLRSFSEKKSCLNSDALQEVPRLEAKLVQLAKIQVDQDERAREISDDTLALIGQYNEIIETISKTFLQYDSFIAAEEEKTQKKH